MGCSSTAPLLPSAQSSSVRGLGRGCAHEEVAVSHDCLRGSPLHWSPIANQHFYGRGAGVGRTREVGVALGVAVAVGVGVGVDEADCTQYLPPVLR